MILSSHSRYLSYFNYLLYPPLKAVAEEILNEIWTCNLFKKCMSQFFSFLDSIFMVLSSLSVN